MIGRSAAPPVPPLTYTIPATNPFTQTIGYRPEILALDVRNPWRSSFDRQTGDWHGADVGQNLWEEVDVQLAASPGGENYGWRCYGGNPTQRVDNHNPVMWLR